MKASVGADCERVDELERGGVDGQPALGLRGGYAHRPVEHVAHNADVVALGVEAGYACAVERVVVGA